MAGPSRLAKEGSDESQIRSRERIPRARIRACVHRGDRLGGTARDHAVPDCSDHRDAVGRRPRRRLHDHQLRAQLGGQLVANGNFTGTLTNAAGEVTNLAGTAVSSVVTPAQTSTGCQILDLTLGPLHLDLLGLVVDLDQVHLNITAQPGRGTSSAICFAR